MPIAPTYPGLYIEEVPSGVRAITGVATSIAAFVGFFSRGSLGRARRILSFADFEREFGGLHPESLASYAIHQFFLNGGQQAWVVRTAKKDSPKAAKVTLNVEPSTPVLTIEAASEGAWGNGLRVEVDYGTTEPETFNLTVSEVVGEAVVRTESFRNLSLDAGNRRFVVRVVGDESKLVKVSSPGNELPAQTGTVSKLIADMSSLEFTDDPGGGDPLTQKTLKVGTTDVPITLEDDATPRPATLAELATRLQQAIRRAHAELRRVSVTVVRTAAGGYLRVKAGTDDPTAMVELTGTLADELEFQSNFQQYALGSTSTTLQPAEEGSDGALPEAEDLQAALQKFDPDELINLISIPDTDRLEDDLAATVITQATAYAEARRAFYIADPPNPSSIARDREGIEDWLHANGTLRHKNAAAYFPRVVVGDPLDGHRPRPIPNSGTLAGVYARTDVERGVWKAPAGLEAVLRGVLRLEQTLSDAENGILNPRGLNSLRTFATAGNVSWGARTLAGSDELASEWKYVPVRRLALFLEESLYRGTQFAVFEPNDEPLWAQIRLNIGAFLQRLFGQGAFQGKSPREAYFVKCDRETTTQADIDLGIVNIIVGFAPLKPAEFVILKFTQIAGTTQV
jgi:uncharacterized protein